MALDEPPEDDSLCGAELSSKPGQYCDNKIAHDDGKCGFHSDESDHSAGNWKHGANASRSAFYQQLDEEDQAWVQSIFESFMQEASFDEDSRGKCELLWNVCIDIAKQRSINEYIAKEEVAVSRFQGAGESGAFYEDEENPLHLTYDRLSKSNIRTLKELGLLDDPDSQQADAQQSFVDIISSSLDD